MGLGGYIKYVEYSNSWITIVNVIKQLQKMCHNGWENFGEHNALTG